MCMKKSERRRRRDEARVTPRDAAVPDEPMLLAFDVDCGELIRGHRFVARGIRDTGTIDRPDAAGESPGFSLEYELVGLASRVVKTRISSRTWLVSHTKQMYLCRGTRMTAALSHRSKAARARTVLAEIGRSRLLRECCALS
jgi:hypothetical protein